MGITAGRRSPSLSSIVFFSTCILLQVALTLSVSAPDVKAASICPVAKITGPVTGGATKATIPIEVPQFHKGLTPSADLTYNSAGASGWLGRGWDLVLGSIQKEGQTGLREVLLRGGRRRPGTGQGQYGIRPEGAVEVRVLRARAQSPGTEILSGRRYRRDAL